MDQRSTLDRLNREKDYEDRLAQRLCDYFLSCLDDIGLSDGQRELADRHLTTIRNETERHADRFNRLIQMVVERGEDNY
jgi:hypothetical protein